MAQVKTAVSLDKALFEQIDALALRLKVSRSRLFAVALEEFLRHHENEQLLQDLNQAYQDEPDEIQQTPRQGMGRLHRKIVAGEW